MEPHVPESTGKGRKVGELKRFFVGHDALAQVSPAASPPTCYHRPFALALFSGRLSSPHQPPLRTSPLTTLVCGAERVTGWWAVRACFVFCRGRCRRCCG
jgi:hypothetical protein